MAEHSTPEAISLTQYQRVETAVAAYNAARLWFLLAVLGTLAFWLVGPTIYEFGVRIELPGGEPHVRPIPLAWGLFAGIVGVGWLALIVSVYRLSAATIGLAPLWALLTVVPIVNLVALLALSTLARRWMCARGVQFPAHGLLGPTPESVQAVHDRVQVEGACGAAAQGSSDRETG